MEETPTTPHTSWLSFSFILSCRCWWLLLSDLARKMASFANFPILLGCGSTSDTIFQFESAFSFDRIEFLKWVNRKVEGGTFCCSSQTVRKQYRIGRVSKHFCFIMALNCGNRFKEYCFVLCIFCDAFFGMRFSKKEMECFWKVLEVRSSGRFQWIFWNSVNWICCIIFTKICFVRQKVAFQTYFHRNDPLIQMYRLIRPLKPHQPLSWCRANVLPNLRQHYSCVSPATSTTRICVNEMWSMTIAACHAAYCACMRVEYF